MPLLTQKQLANELAVSERTLHRYVARGKIRCYRLPGGTKRFDLSKVLADLEVKKR